MIDLTGLTEQAEAERARYRAALGRTTGNHTTRAAALLTERKRHEATIGDLRKAAEDAIEAERAAIRAARAAEVERLRALLGDVVLVHLYERWIERMNARELAALRQRENDLHIAQERERQLDPISWKQDVAPRLGVKPEFMEMPA